MDDAQSAVLLVAPSFDAALIGAGTDGAPLQPLFGSMDFKAYNIGFENRAVSADSFILLKGAAGIEESAAGELFDLASTGH